jgi:hypothetical protein
MKLDVNGIELAPPLQGAAGARSDSFAAGDRECAIAARVCDLRAQETSAANKNTAAKDRFQAGWRHAFVFERLAGRVHALLGR